MKKLRSVEVEGRTREEALRKALEELGAKEGEVEVEVLEEGPKAVQGLLGTSRVRLRVKFEPDLVRRVVGMIQKILDLMGSGSRAFISSHSEGKVGVEIEGGELGMVIGRRGRTLDALQYLANVLLQKYGERRRITLDADGYRERREGELRRRALEAARRVVEGGREVRIGPLLPHERRIIHASLSERSGVMTYSEGEGEERVVVVSPKR